MRHTYEKVLDLGDLGERTCQVEYAIHPASRGSREPGTGLLLSPDEPSYCEVTGITYEAPATAYQRARVVDLFDVVEALGNMGALEEEIWEWEREQAEAAAADRAYEEYRDRAAGF